LNVLLVTRREGRKGSVKLAESLARVHCIHETVDGTAYPRRTKCPVELAAY
jgi:hypothetical protein